MGAGNIKSARTAPHLLGFGTGAARELHDGSADPPGRGRGPGGVCLLGLLTHAVVVM